MAQYTQHNASYKWNFTGACVFSPLSFICFPFTYQIKAKQKLISLSILLYQMKMNNNSLSFFLTFCIAVYVFIFRSYKCFMLFIFRNTRKYRSLLLLSKFVVPSNNIHLLIDHRCFGNWMVKALCQRISDFYSFFPAFGCDDWLLSVHNCVIGTVFCLIMQWCFY